MSMVYFYHNTCLSMKFICKIIPFFHNWLIFSKILLDTAGFTTMDCIKGLEKIKKIIYKNINENQKSLLCDFNNLKIFSDQCWVLLNTLYPSIPSF